MISVEYLVLRNNVECTRLTADSETAAQVSMDNITDGRVCHPTDSIQIAL